MKLQQDLREFVERLSAENVDFVIVGADALAVHGHPWYTGDLDILLRPSRENAERVLSVLDGFGFDDLGISLEDLLSMDQVVQLGVSPDRIDLVVSLDGLSFVEVWDGRISTKLDEIEVNVISREHLIINKLAVVGPKILRMLRPCHKMNRSRGFLNICRAFC